MLARSTGGDNVKRSEAIKLMREAIFGNPKLDDYTVDHLLASLGVIVEPDDKPLPEHLKLVTTHGKIHLPGYGDSLAIVASAEVVARVWWTATLPQLGQALVDAYNNRNQNSGNSNSAWRTDTPPGIAAYDKYVVIVEDVNAAPLLTEPVAVIAWWDGRWFLPPALKVATAHVVMWTELPLQKRWPTT
jgi:hypothetical protein